MLIYAIVLFFYYDESQKNAINQAQIRTEDILRNVKATEKFFNEDQKDQYVNKDAFSSELSSCTNATVKINDYYNELREEDLLKKIKISFVAQNPKNPKNSATQKELIILDKFNNHKLQFYNKIIDTKKGKYLYYAEPTQRLTQSCLKCHWQNKSFHHGKGEIAAYIKILMPLDKYINEAKNLFWIIVISTFFNFDFYLYFSKTFSD